MPILFHYCTTATFQSIIQNRSIWLSSLLLSNDYLEGKLVRKILSELAHSDELGSDALIKLEQSLIAIENIVDGFGFCLSENGDLLSQWRGYTENATGFSIGFSVKYLLALSESIQKRQKPSFSLQQVEYDKKKQIELLKPTYKKIKETIEKSNYKYPVYESLIGKGFEEAISRENERLKKVNTILIDYSLKLVKNFFNIKSDAFSEEKEWRLICHQFRAIENNYMFLSKSDRLVPYQEYELEQLSQKAIEKVFIGPKNRTPKYVLEHF